MIFILKKKVKKALRRMGSLFYTRQEMNGNRIIMYHSVGGTPGDHRFAIRVKESNFKAQLEEIRRLGYVTVTVSELVKRELFSKDMLIALTFDDGYKDNLFEAARLLEDMDMKATFFITTAYIDGRLRKIWADGKQREYLSWADVKELVRMGFEIGSHMVDHIALTSQSEEGAVSQLVDSRNEITDKAGFEPKVFSYPYGKIPLKIEEKAKAAGYICGCSSIPGINHPRTGRYVLRRTEIDGYDTISDFRDKLAGRYD